jgi:hypothetical protein
MSCCGSSLDNYMAMTPTQQIYAIKAELPVKGNLASGLTDDVAATVERGAVAKLEAGVRPIGDDLCCTPVIPVHAGGNSSGGFLQKCIRDAEVQAAAQRLALAKVRGIPGCPVYSINPATRFQAYQRLPPPAPCPDLRTNAGVPHAVPGPCTNVIGIVQTWPPH